MTTQSSNILLVLANAVDKFNGSMSDVRSAANILVSNLGINNFTTQTMGVLVPFKKSLIDLGFNTESVNDFMIRLGVICDCKDKAIGKYTKQRIAAIKSFLELANQKQAVVEKAAHDAQMAAIAQHPAIAPIVAACDKSRELVTELADCNEARFFEICNEVEQIGYSNEIPLRRHASKEIQNALGENFDKFIYSKFITQNINMQVLDALRRASERLGLFLMYNENGEFMNTECDETQGCYAFYVMDNVIGWVCEKQQPISTTKPRELVELDECLNAQIALSRATVSIDNNYKEFANVTNASALAGVSVGDYFDLYSEAGWELDFEPMQLEQVQDIYAAAKQRDGDDDDKNSAGELVEQFAKFIHKQLFEKRNAFDKLIDSSDCEVSLFAYDLMINKSTKILLQVKGSGNVCLKHLCSGNNNGSVCSVSFCIHQCQFFKTFYCFKMETFFKDILQDNL